MLHVKENLECVIAICGDHGGPFEWFWVKFRVVVSKGSLTVDICHWPPNQDDRASEAIFGSLKQTSGQQNLVLMGEFNYPDICWKNHTAVDVPSVEFLECTGNCFLVQMLDVPTRSEALLKNGQDLFCNSWISDSLGGSDHNIVVFGIWLSMLKAVLRQKLWSLEEHTWAHSELSWEGSMEDKGASDCWEFFKDVFLAAQKQLIPFKGEGSKQNKRSSWLNYELLSVFKTKRVL